MNRFPSIQSIKNSPCMIKEIWKDIEGQEGVYQVSNFGKVKRVAGYFKSSLGRKQWLKQKITLGQLTRGYRKVTLRINGKRKGFSVHRLVAIAFIPNTNNYPCINHKDGNRSNNCFSNLEWCTMAMNNQHAHDTGLNPSRKGTKSPEANASRRFVVDYFDKNGNYKGTFKSLCEAAEILGIRQSAISQCIIKKPSNPRKYIFKLHDAQ